jgi:hypothetical protein
MLIRHGVRLTPKRADMFDMIERVTEAGGRIPVAVLADVFYPGVATAAAKNNVRVMVSQLNEYLEETDVQIKALRVEGYRLERRAAK